MKELRVSQQLSRDHMMPVYVSLQKCSTFIIWLRLTLQIRAGTRPRLASELTKVCAPEDRDPVASAHA